MSIENQGQSRRFDIWSLFKNIYLNNRHRQGIEEKRKFTIISDQREDQKYQQNSVNQGTNKNDEWTLNFHLLIKKNYERLMICSCVNKKKNIKCLSKTIPNLRISIIFSSQMTLLVSFTKKKHFSVVNETFKRKQHYLVFRSYSSWITRTIITKISYPLIVSYEHWTTSTFFLRDERRRNEKKKYLSFNENHVPSLWTVKIFFITDDW